jgi:hypothetical protein
MTLIHHYVLESSAGVPSQVSYLPEKTTQVSTVLHGYLIRRDNDREAVGSITLPASKTLDATHASAGGCLEPGRAQLGAMLWRTMIHDDGDRGCKLFEFCHPVVENGEGANNEKRSPGAFRTEMS